MEVILIDGKQFIETSKLFNVLCKKSKQFTCKIRSKKTKFNVNIGHFISEQEAALFYDLYAIMAYGEFANLNFPKISPFAKINPITHYYTPRGRHFIRKFNM